MDIFDLIVGAIIGLVVSIITSFIAHRLELSRNQQNRNWQIEDHKKIAITENIKTRITRIEDAIESLWETALSITKRETSFLALVTDVSVSDLLRVLHAEDEKSFQTILETMKKTDPINFDLTSNKVKKYLAENDETKKTETEAVSKAMKSLSYISSLNQDDLMKNATDFLMLITEESAQSKRLSLAIKNKKKISIKNEHARIQKFISKLISLHSTMINQMAALQAENFVLGEK